MGLSTDLLVLTQTYIRYTNQNICFCAKVMHFLWITLSTYTHFGGKLPPPLCTETYACFRYYREHMFACASIYTNLLHQSLYNSKYEECSLFPYENSGLLTGNYAECST